MFDQLSAPETVHAMGRTARAAARGGELATSQLMSTYSASRHLVVELTLFEDELRHFCTRVSAAVRAHSTELPSRATLEATAAGLEGSHDARHVGDAVASLLDLLRVDPAPAAAVLREEVRAALRDLADRQVELLADGVERRRR